MSDTQEPPELAELQPLEEGEVVSPMIAEQTLATLRAGLPPPAHNPRAEKDYYRFLFASVMVLLGCLMPWSWNLGHAGYKTLGGSLVTLFAIVLVWRWWAAIHTRSFGGKDLLWVVIAFVPLGWMVTKLLNAWDAPGIQAWSAEALGTETGSWALLFESEDKWRHLGEFLRAFGPGRILVLAGSLLLEVFMVMAIFGGAKKVKEQKAAARAAASERKRR